MKGVAFVGAVCEVGEHGVEVVLVRVLVCGYIVFEPVFVDVCVVKIGFQQS